MSACDPKRTLQLQSRMSAFRDTHTVRKIAYLSLPSMLICYVWVNVFLFPEVNSWQRNYFLSATCIWAGMASLQHCDYTNEFVGFLKKLEGEGTDTELLIVGDTFGFWETTLVH